jgi:acyl homoserine lactone synthase
MLHIIAGDCIDQHKELADSMFELRYEVFVKRLGWQLDCPEGAELDQFDHDFAQHLIVTNPREQAVASCRLLPTDQPHLLGDVFPFLAANGAPPRDALIWEATRLAVDHRPDRLEGCTNPTGELLAGIMEYALSLGLSHLVSVSDARVERILRRCGWNLTRLGEPTRMDGVDVIGEITEVSEESLRRVRERCGITGPVLPANFSRRAA